MSKHTALIIIAIWLVVFAALSAAGFFTFDPITKLPVFAIALSVMFAGYFANGLVGSVLRGIGAVHPTERLDFQVINALFMREEVSDGIDAP